jgi:hypothetical protein
MSLKTFAETEYHALVAKLLGVEQDVVPYLLAVLKQFESVGWTQLLGIAAAAEGPIAAAVLSGGSIGVAITAAATTAEAAAIADATTDGKNAVYTVLGMVQAKITQAQADAAPAPSPAPAA